MPAVFRRLARAPGFVIATIASLALAVGANTAIFSVVNALWLRPLPVREARQIVVPYYPVVHSIDGELLDDVRLPAARELAAAGAFEDVTYELNGAARTGDWRPVLRPAPGDTPIGTLAVAANYFAVLGVRIEGRSFSESEDQPGSDPAAVVSSRLWIRYVGDRPFVGGVSIPTIRGPVPVIGVAPEGFHGPRLGDAVDLWITMGALGRLSEFASEPGLERLTPVTVFARLRPGVSLEAAEAEARSVLHTRTSLRRLRDVAFPLRSEGGLLRQRSLVQTLWAAAVLVLVLGCTNLAALFMARMVSHRQAMAIRLSLGGTRAHLVGMVAAEASVLAAAGLAAGLLFRAWLLRGVAALETSAGVAVATLDTGLDWRVAVFGGLTAVVALAIAAGGAAIQASRTSVGQLVSGSSFGGTRAHTRLRQLLLAAHAALAVALLVAAGALVSTVGRAFAADDAFARRDLIVASVRPSFLQYMNAPDGPARQVRDIAGAIARLEALPSIDRVTHGDAPMRPHRPPEPTTLIVDGRAVQTPIVRLEGGPGYLRAIGAPLIDGRDLSEPDIRESVAPREMMRFITLRRLPRFREPMPKGGRAFALVDATLAALLWPDGGGVGRSFIWKPLEITYTVTGIAAPMGRHPRLPGVVPTMIAPQLLEHYDGFRPLGLVMRAVQDGRAHRVEIANLLRDVFPDAPILEVNTAAELLETEMAQERMGARIFSYYAVAAVMLALVGVYGLLAFLVRHSRLEFAVRFALGASHRSLAVLALLRVLVPVAAGAAIGIALSQVFGAALAARVVGLGEIPLWSAMAAAALFCLLSLVSGLAAATGIGRAQPHETLRAH